MTPAKKSLGQHFLVDRRVVGRIMEAAQVTSDDTVLEIGPGRGVLTRALADRAGRVVAVEIDARLAEALRDSLAGRLNVSVLTEDARDSDIDALVPPPGPFKVVANLPYYAANPIVRRFLEADRKPSLMVVMVQREVAREMAAPPGKMRVLSVATQLYGRPRVVASVPPRAFRPPPKVTSAVVRIDVYPRPLLNLDSVEGFFRLVKAGFSAPRKQLRNCMRLALDVPPERMETAFQQAGVDPTRRAQTVSVPEWGQLYESFQATGHLLQWSR